MESIIRLLQITVEHHYYDISTTSFYKWELSSASKLLLRQRDCFFRKDAEGVYSVFMPVDCKGFRDGDYLEMDFILNDVKFFHFSHMGTYDVKHMHTLIGQTGRVDVMSSLITDDVLKHSNALFNFRLPLTDIYVERAKAGEENKITLVFETDRKKWGYILVSDYALSNSVSIEEADDRLHFGEPQKINLPWDKRRQGLLFVSEESVGVKYTYDYDLSLIEKETGRADRQRVLIKHIDYPVPGDVLCSETEVDVMLAILNY
ncbi:MAG: hypothetical protein K6G31_04120 [Paludibacteraceae bacterium]|nr:hypothetical protein [Paludibacteraceae bacterium]